MMYLANEQVLPLTVIQACRPRGGDMRSEKTLPAELFLSQLQRERRRAERTKGPLSLAVFRYDGGNLDDEFANADRLLQHLHRIKRDIDVLGYIDDGMIGVILLDTNAEGAQGFLQRLSAQPNDLRFPGITFTFPDGIFDRLLSGGDGLSPTQSIFFGYGNVRRGAIAKRLIDIVIASTVLVLCAPLMLATAIAVAATSPGPVIFRQTRLGRDGAPFVLYKFRSMYQDADESIHRDHVANLIGAPGGTDEANGKKTWQKIDNDPRITPVGRILRNLKVDELPQIFNVLKGDLSLVGPRPPIPYEVALYQAWHLRRILAVKPGITGLWQIESEDSVSFDSMVRMDLQYVANASILIDLKIFYRTVAVIVRRAIAVLVSPAARQNASC
jgi:lipopolysaccharide/colanic/teichoic acid biosynthesis glycosyltransferase